MHIGEGGPVMAPSGDAFDDDPLIAPLSADQLALLEAIVRPVVAAHDHGGNSEWPAWAYVEDHLEADHPSLDPLQIFRSLPTVHGLPGGRRYGLAWRADNRTTDPTPEERVGLSIAGLYQLHRAGRVPGVADALVRLLSSLSPAQRS